MVTQTKAESQIITLTPSESMIAGLIASWRIVVNRTKGINDLKRDQSQESPDLDLHGVGAELAAAKFFNCWPDLNISQGAYNPWDLRVNGRTIEVKHTKLLNGKLLVKPSDEGATIYLLVVGQIPTYSIVGYASHEEVFVRTNLTNPGWGICHALTQEYLHNPEELTTGDHQ